MISKQLAKMLNEQIGHELQASQQYLAISIYFHMKQLDGWGAFFRRQAAEERFHAMKILDFLISVDSRPIVPSVEGVSSDFKSDLDPVKASLDWERQVTKQIHDMADQAFKDKDHTSLQFLQWFISEQIEEENLMEKLVALVKSGINMFQAEPLLPTPEEDHEN
ncbi:MAG: ferritin [Fimbriimonadales bacterium]|nr:ferritin [Fimbriimonadales bacterium]